MLTTDPQTNDVTPDLQRKDADACKPWLVWKFGGTSVGDARRLCNVADLASSAKSWNTESVGGVQLAVFPDLECEGSSGRSGVRLAIVTSAMAGVTNSLQSCCDEAAMEFYGRRRLHGHKALYQRNEEPSSTTYGYRKTLLSQVQERHKETAKELNKMGEITKSQTIEFIKNLDHDIMKILNLLDCMAFVGACALSLQERVMGYGEIWSSTLLFFILANRLNKESHKGCETPSTTTDSPVAEEEANSKNIRTPNDNDTSNRHRSNGSSGAENNCPFCPDSLVRMAPDPADTTSNDKSYTRFCSCSGALVCWMDAREILVTRGAALCARGVGDRIYLNRRVSALNLEQWLKAHPCCEVAIITGYICSTRTGVPTTLRRNGSDYSGALFANLLHAKCYTVWTDVDGVFTADPRKVNGAFRIPYLSYAEAVELAYFGAKVLHPLTMEPCIRAKIPILLRSSLEPQSLGTYIGKSTACRQELKVSKERGRCAFSRPGSAELDEEDDDEEEGVEEGRRPDTPSTEEGEEGLSLPLSPIFEVSEKVCPALTAIDHVSLVSLSGTSMIGVPGISTRLFGAIHEANCQVIMISQASAEHSICFAVPSAQAQRAKAAVEGAFYKEMTHDKCMRVSLINQCSIVCAVGEKMFGAMGILGTLANALATADVNVKAVTQGASEMNITFVVDNSNSIKALKAMHDAIYNCDPIYSPNEIATKKCFTASAANTREEFALGLLFLVPALPLPSAIQNAVKALVQDIGAQLLRRTPLEEQGSPLKLVGFTDSYCFAETLQDASNSDNSPAKLLPLCVVEEYRQDKAVALVDLRSEEVLDIPFDHGTPGEALRKRVQLPSTTAAPLSFEDVLRNQNLMIDHWTGQGRLVVCSTGLRLAPALESLIRILSRSTAVASINDYLTDLRQIKMMTGWLPRRDSLSKGCGVGSLSGRYKSASTLQRNLVVNRNEIVDPKFKKSASVVVATARRRSFTVDESQTHNNNLGRRRQAWKTNQQSQAD